MHMYMCVTNRLRSLTAMQWEELAADLLWEACKVRTVMHLNATRLIWAYTEGMQMAKKDEATGERTIALPPEIINKYKLLRDTGQLPPEQMKALTDK